MLPVPGFGLNEITEHFGVSLPPVWGEQRP
jgi:hypothetical protein